METQESIALAWGNLKAAAVGLVLTLAAGCVTTTAPVGGGTGLDHEKTLHVGSAAFVISYGFEDETVIELIAHALEEAAARVRVWGDLSHPVELRIYPSHEALEVAVGKRGYPWLRAWARYDEILLQSPRTFDLFERGDANLFELMTHELTHCLMYQRASTHKEWRMRDRSIPIWFREGMASYTARQGHRRLSEARLVEWRERTGRDPLGEASELYQRNPEIAYAAAHWAFAFLVERYGAERIRKILGAMYEGRQFPEAFEMVMGLSARTFTDEYLRYLDWGGWIDRERPRASDILVSKAKRRLDEGVFSRRPSGPRSHPGPKGAAAPALARRRDVAAEALPR